MKHRYIITSADDAPLDILPVAGSAHLFDVTYAGQTTRVDARLQGGRLNLLLGPQSVVTCDVAPAETGARVSIHGHQISVGILDERQFLRRARAGAEVDTGAEVKSPMAGRIVKILVEPGQDVRQGQGLLIVEAMKMENEIKATRAAQIASISVKPGQSVDLGQLLVSFAG